MKQIINFSKFVDAFQDMGRDESFSYDGKEALFEYLEECEANSGTEVELDVVALCCEYTEYEDVEEYTDVYGLPYGTCPHCGEDLLELSEFRCPDCGQSTIDREAVLWYIRYRTSIIHIKPTDGFIIVDY